MPVSTRSPFAPRRLFRELRREVAKAVFLNELMNAAIVFFAINIVLTIFNMSFWPSVAVAVVMLAWRTARGFRKAVLVEIERGNPEVHEILRTAYEYQRENTLMAQGLLYELQRKLSTVSTGVLIKPKTVMTKLIAIALLAFMPALIISFTPYLIQANPLQNVNLGSIVNNQTTTGIKDFFAPTKLNTTNLTYGDAQMLNLGNDKLNVQVRSGGSQVSFDQVGNPQSKTFTYNNYPSDITPQAAAASTGGVYSAEDVQLINDYACQTKGACAK